MRKSIYTSQIGSISMFVMIAMAFLLVTIVGVYMISGKRAQTQTESVDIMQSKYYTEGEENEKYSSKVAADNEIIPIYTKEQLWSIGEEKTVEIEGKLYDFSQTDLSKYELKNDIVINISESENLEVIDTSNINKNNFEVYYYYNEDYYVPASGSEVDLTIQEKNFQYANLSKDLGYVTDGLVLHYDGIKNTATGHSSDTTKWKDLSGNGNDGTIHSEFIWKDKSLKLNDNSSGIVGQYMDNLKLTDFTIEMTLESYNADSNNAILYDFHTSGNTGYFTKITNNSLFVAFGNTRYNYEYNFLNAVYPINIVLKCDKSNGNFKIMLNGQNVYTYMGNIDIEKSTGSLFGVLNNDQCDEGAYFGNLNNFKLYNRALTDSEIQQNYEVDKARFGIENLDYVKDGLVLHYDGINNTGAGHNASATTWKDLSGHGNDGTLNGGTWEDNNLSLNGSSFVKARSNPVFDQIGGTPDMTVEVVSEKSTRDYGNIIGLTANVNQYTYMTLWTCTGDDGRCYSVDYSTGSGATDYQSKIFSYTDIPLNTKNSISYGKNATNYFTYLNASKKDDVAIRNSLGWKSNEFYVGRPTSNNYYFTGKVYSVRIYNRALTDTEVQRNYAIDKARFGIE